ncbi:MAG: hypothetical protein QXJ07_05495 [Candidatus Bathyarchaeia archaeon]
MPKKCENCGGDLKGEVVKVQDLFCDAEYHYFCSEECAKDWLFDNWYWDYVDAADIKDEEDSL